MDEVVVKLRLKGWKWRGTVAHIGTLDEQGHYVYVWCWGSLLVQDAKLLPEGSVATCLECVARGPKRPWNPDVTFMGRPTRTEMSKGKLYFCVDTETHGK